jgi:hypothetical protein
MVRRGNEMVLTRLGFNQKILDAWGTEIDAGVFMAFNAVIVY